MRGKTISNTSNDSTKAELTEYIEQFLTALNFPHAYDWKQQTPRWRQAMSLLSITWEMYKLQLTRTAYEK